MSNFLCNKEKLLVSLVTMTFNHVPILVSSGSREGTEGVGVWWDCGSGPRRWHYPVTTVIWRGPSHQDNLYNAIPLPELLATNTRVTGNTRETGDNGGIRDRLSKCNSRWHGKTWAHLRWQALFSSYSAALDRRDSVQIVVTSICFNFYRWKGGVSNTRRLKKN